PNNQFPEALAADWNNYFEHFRTYYSLDEKQADLAELVFRQSMSKTSTWMTAETKLIARPLPQGATLMMPMTVSQRLQDFEKKEEEARNIEDNVRPHFTDKNFAALRDAKDQARRVRAELRSDLNQQTDSMKKALVTVLRGNQKISREIGGGVAG